MSRRTGTTHNMRGLLGETLAKRGLKLGVGRARSVLMWPQVVGPELARLTRARNQHGGTLFVEARDSAQAHHLTMQRHHVLARLRIAMGDESVTELRFVVGTLPPEAAVVVQDALPPPDRARAQQLVHDVPDTIRDAAVRAAEAITRARKWREQQGYSPCPVCGEAAAEQPCYACSLTLKDPAVRRSVPLLARDPRLLVSLPQILGESGIRAARFLALDLLRDQMNLLALECVRSGGEVYYREYLGEQARLYVALSLERSHAPLTRSSMKLLPATVAQVLAGSVEQEG